MCTRSFPDMFPTPLTDSRPFQRGGFFLEAGALDGYYQSNTFFLERDLGWTGLLVEPNPVFFESLLTRHRRAWATDLCLGTKPYPVKVIRRFGNTLFEKKKIGLTPLMYGNATL